ncbi:hypothetical protein FF098_014710 [Parvularcula flava]|uniref:Uncharacterized protein n=1 Tax=Aquisalinus luteolus TaxID=1566827 RepID=A0A8J3A3E1_9PROT|nr:GcrA family cell cycle regulator [Aquisalinus luteolus]NHK29169.1 hypothetical protein [Aquisalinus luteolus]GGI00095.1 hypothetical protein GCM10011355_27580 [Aquisalinus luteolus]
MSWGQEETDEICRLWNAGESAGQIAMKLKGKSRNAVIGKLVRLYAADDERIIRPIGGAGRGHGAPSGPKTVEAQKRQDQNDLYLMQCRKQTYPDMPYKYHEIEQQTGMRNASARLAAIMNDYQRSEKS